MTQTKSNHVTTQQIAARAGVSQTTVSFALRRHPKIPFGTAEKVRAVAAEMGYRPNPRVAALMSHIRKSRRLPVGERIAFIWVHTSRRESEESPFLRRVFRGAAARAETMGYTLEPFWLNQDGLTPRRLAQVLRSRGIVGILLSPVMHEVEVKVDFDWSGFAPVIIGNARWNPELHRAAHYHYLGMRLCLERLIDLGCRRPFALLEPEINLRAQRAWEASFLAFTPGPRTAIEFLQPDSKAYRSSLRSRLNSFRPDALIVSSDAANEQLAKLKVRLPQLKAKLSLHWTPSSEGMGGIDLAYDFVAANAVDLVVNQLNSNETGVPAWPRILLFPGRLIDPPGAVEPKSVVEP